VKYTPLGRPAQVVWVAGYHQLDDGVNSFPNAGFFGGLPLIFATAFD
jgi:hypothetical protein